MVPAEADVNRTIYSYGYTGGKLSDLQAYAEAGATVLDIRLRPWSWVVQWRGQNLTESIGEAYRQCQDLGNENYRTGGPIRIRNLARGLDALAWHIRRGPVVLLCGCPEVALCHRLTVCNLAIESGLADEAIHLLPGDDRVARGLSQGQEAERLGVTRRELNAIEHGRDG